MCSTDPSSPLAVLCDVSANALQQDFQTPLVQCQGEKFSSGTCLGIISEQVDDATNHACRHFHMPKLSAEILTNVNHLIHYIDLGRLIYSIYLI